MKNNTKKETIKQYVLAPAYTDNTWIVTFENGHVVNETIISNYEIPGATSILRMQGYTRAYDMVVEERKMQEAREEYERALEIYEDSKKCALYVADDNSDDIKSYRERIQQ